MWHGQPFDKLVAGSGHARQRGQDARGLQFLHFLFGTTPSVS